jgi:methionyl-tRNA formyltransferase
MVAPPALRVVFFGTPAFAVPSLSAILSSAHPVVGVVTQPDRPRGRGQKTTEAPVKALARSAATPVLQPERLADAAFLDAFEAWNADIGVVAAYGRILSDRVLAIPRLGMINVHASLLPKYRGAAPVHRAVIAGERETGVTIMRVVRALDAGPMMLKGSRAIAPDETSEVVERDLAVLGARLLVRTLDDLSAGRAVETPQDESQATYAHRLTKEEGLVNWAATAEHLHNQIRGLYPWPHAYSFLRGRRIILLQSTWSDDPVDGQPGAVTAIDAHGISVAAGRGVLRILQLQPEGRRPMSARDFLGGHPVAAGDHFEPR